MIFVYIFISIIIFLAFFLYLSFRKDKIKRIFREMKLSGEAFILGPEMASYRGASTKYGRIKSDGLIGLTPEKIIFIPLLGKKIIISIAEIRDVRESKTFLGQYRAGRPVLVLHGNELEIGFFVKDIQKWHNTIKGIVK